ncbi:MAG: Peptide deformylase [Candidatus Magasanikbacteria bacterium GW2011_GWA2_37_8]|uniref:Peptide deformylase n=1 Tax=Candidatus Magasanikbacteria bacterium GW2011_GWA2_37_8 TaxID=1619036 RepID=A0A0G0HG61_9BACT|nr:MAG: Peptide deformylase [Candidatus Magasanikbacteria bacterium GW2011_GWA2_37_8]
MLKIITLPTKSLRERSKEIEVSFLKTATAKKLIKEMVPIMYAADGIGLAAPQVNHNIRLCVIGKEATPNKKQDLILVNPEWEKLSRKTAWDTEGCLSVPKLFGKVKRYTKIKVQALDESGKTLNFVAQDFFARVIQHEVDHLNGILFIDKAKDIFEAKQE